MTGGAALEGGGTRSGLSLQVSKARLEGPGAPRDSGRGPCPWLGFKVPSSPKHSRTPELQGSRGEVVLILCTGVEQDLNRVLMEKGTQG